MRGSSRSHEQRSVTADTRRHEAFLLFFVGGGGVRASVIGKTGHSYVRRRDREIDMSSERERERVSNGTAAQQGSCARCAVPQRSELVTVQYWDLVFIQYWEIMIIQH